MVQLRWARLTEQGVKAMGFQQYTFKEYKNMGHSSCDEVSRLSLPTLDARSGHLGNGRCECVRRQAPLLKRPNFAFTFS